MTEALTRLTNALTENSRPLPDDASVAVRAGDLRQLLQSRGITSHPNPIPVLDRLRSAD